MDRKNLLVCVLIVCGLLGLSKSMGWIGVEKMTPVEAAAEPLVSEMPVIRVWKGGDGIAVPFADTSRLLRNWNAAMDEMLRIGEKARAIGDRLTFDAIGPLGERLVAVSERMDKGDYDAEREEEEIRAVRMAVREMGLVVDSKKQ